jgi:hypothetical protein
VPQSGHSTFVGSSGVTLALNLGESRPVGKNNRTSAVYDGRDTAGVGGANDPRPAASYASSMTPTTGRRLTRRLILWVGGLLVAALTSMIVGVLTGIPGQVFDVESVKDSVRPGPDFRSSVEIVNLADQGFSVAFPGAYRPSPGEARLASRLDGNTAPQLDARLRAHGAVDLRKLSLRIALEGRSNEELRILDIRPVDVVRTAPVAGTLFYIPPQEGAATLRMIVNLDDPLPVVRTAVIGSGDELVGTRPFFEENTIRLRDRERDVILLRATAERYSVRFKLEVEYLIGAKRKHAVIDDDGRPFRVTGMNCTAEPGIASYANAYELGNDPQGLLRLVEAPDPSRLSMRYSGCAGT